MGISSSAMPRADSICKYFNVHMYLSNWNGISSRGTAGSCFEHKTGIAEHILTQALQFPLKN